MSTKMSKTSKPKLPKVVKTESPPEDDDTEPQVVQAPTETVPVVSDFIATLRAKTEKAREAHRQSKVAKDEEQTKRLAVAFDELTKEFVETFQAEFETPESVRRGFVNLVDWASGESYAGFPYNYLLCGTPDDKLDHFRKRGLLPVQDRLLDMDTFRGMNIHTPYDQRTKRKYLRVHWV